VAFLYLTNTEEQMLKGEYGQAVALCMRLLTALGDVFGAEKLIKVDSVQISGVSYKNIGDWGLDFLESLAGAGGKVSVKTTLNPAGMDLKRWREMGVKKSFAEKQLRIIKAFRKMGIPENCTCTPYFAGNRPRLNQHVAWAESSAVVFANSVLGARTNRESGPTALASAITGRTPLYGYHLDENRKPTLLVEVDPSIIGSLEYSGLGYFIGKNFNFSVPYFSGLREPKIDELKALGAGLASSGAIALYYMKNISRECVGFAENIKTETVTVTKKDIKQQIEELSLNGNPDCIFVGCPHCSLNEIMQIAKKVKGKKVSRKFWVCTSRNVFRIAEKNSYVKIIEDAGGLVLCDTCVVVSPIRELGIRSVATNSCKAAYYLPSTSRVKVSLRDLDGCIKEAVN
jgi:predicted aconitase